MAGAIAVPQAIVFLPPARAVDVCARPGKDASPTALVGVVNTYYPGAASAGAGATSINLGPSRGAATTITAGDLLLVIQMQDATINFTNTDSYGDGVPGAPANGSTALNTAGLYEYVVATNTVGAGGGTVTFSQPLTNTYTNTDATTTTGQRRFQVVRVPQYLDATITGTVTSVDWNGQTGGIVNLDVAQTLTFAGGTIDASGLGFRGGGGLNAVGTTVVNPIQNQDYVSLSTLPYSGSKGEGIAGAPRYVRIGTSTNVNDTGVEGYPGGSFSRGAPANAGGGATDPSTQSNTDNTGGGGGANVGGGGRGGNSWPDINPPAVAVGGEGGSAFPPNVSRVIMGGGAGAGSANDSAGGIAPSGGGGGGIVMVRANQVVGNGSIFATGVSGVQPQGTDGGGGGGAGGTVLIQALTPSAPALAINVQGGQGLSSGFQEHGPGGGGGGGFIAFQNVTLGAINVAGGAPGNDQPQQAGTPLRTPTSNPAADPYGAEAGGNGLAIATTIPNSQVSTGAECFTPRLRLVKRATAIAAFRPTGFNDAGTNSDDDNAAGWPATPPVFLQGIFGNNQVPIENRPKSGDELEYTIYFLSDGGFDAINSVVCDFIPTSTTYVPGTLSFTLGTTTTALTDSAADADVGQFIAPGGAFPAACSGNNNNRGAVIVNLGTVTASTGPGTPATSYGFIRFRTRVD